MDSNGLLIDPNLFTVVSSKSHFASAKADIYLGGQLLRPGVKIISGAVHVDRTAAIRSQADLTIADPTLTPAQSVYLSPRGYELRIWRSIRLRPRSAYWTGTDFLTGGGEYLTGSPYGPFLTTGATFDDFGQDVDWVDAWVSLGFFVIQDADTNGITLETKIQAEDRGRMVEDASLTDAVVWTTAETLETRVNDMLINALPSIPFVTSFQGTTHVAANVTHERGSGPMTKVLEAAESVGYEAYWDSNGQFVWRPEPNLQTANPVAYVVEGDDGVLVAASLRQSRKPAFNAAPVVGENADNTAEYFAMAVDNDPNSPSYYYGTFGKKPMPVHRDPQIDTQAKADAASTARLQANVGIARSIDFQMVPNPLIEPGDAVFISRPKLGVDEVALVDAQSIGLSVEDSMSAQCRTRTVVA